MMRSPVLCRPSATGLTVVAHLMLSGAASAAPCQTIGTFEKWLEGFKAEAQSAGLKPQTVTGALSGVSYDPSIIARDRRQGFFSQPFLDFQARLATKNRIDNGRAQIRKHRALFDRAEKDFGVPAEVIAGFWALESDFGAVEGMGKLPVLRSLATLAYDCRRGAYFRGQLLDALRIIERGDLTPQQMVGSWAGELGQTQFLPSYYYKYGVDYDGDGTVDLYRSVADVIGTSAKFVKELGWQTGEPWIEEVRVPAQMPWDLADLAQKQPRTRWAQLGVRRADGSPLPADQKPAALLLLMGRNGPAFLAYPNFDVYTQWNQSLNYATTAAYLGTRIAGAPALGPGREPVIPLEPAEMKELQSLLNKRGFPVGEPDGLLGTGTRIGVRAAQKKFGLPADSYPSRELLEQLRGAR